MPSVVSPSQVATQYPRESQCKTWHVWKNTNQSLPRDPLELQLALPEGCLHILKQAFQLHLPRSTGWDLTQVTQPEPYLAAARIYKRGVFTKPTTSPANRSIMYPIHYQHEWSPASITQPHFTVIDAQVAKAWPGLSSIAHHVIFDIDEQQKNLASVGYLCQRYREMNQPMPWMIIGGGVLGDTAAMAATLCQQEFHLVPTTLLAMVDACVGGKTGVNDAQYGKNQLGLFAFPQQVTVATQWLTTLPLRELHGGMSECFKHALLAGDDFLWRHLLQLGTQAQAITLEELKSLVEIKARVVSEDPFEQGLRATLNLGHTLAHALEALAHRTLTARRAMNHGEAVFYGLIFALVLSYETGQLPEATYRRLLHDLTNSDLMPHRQTLFQYVGVDICDPEQWRIIRSLMQHDKKNTDTAIRFVLLSGFGSCAHMGDEWTIPVDTATLDIAWEEWLKIVTQ